MKRTRRIVQAAVLTVIVVGVFVYHANCELWCPFGGVEALYTYASEGNMPCSLGTSNFFILGGVILSALLARRAFCGYMCPIGALTEWFGGLGKSIGLPAWQVSGRLDRVLSMLKYAVLILILAATWRAGELVFRGYGPCYALLSRHGTDITYWAYVVSGAIVVASLVVSLPFCRWFCPFAAVLNPFSRVSFGRIRRDETACTSCGVCSRQCPMAIPVAEMREVTAARCTSCLTCAEACPKRNDGAIAWKFIRPVHSAWSQAAVIMVMVLCTSAGVAAAFAFPFPSFVRSYGAAPAETDSFTIEVNDLTCRGRANLLVYYLERDDLFAVEGYWKLAAWPDPNLAKVQISYDPSQCSEDAFKMAITEPYYDEFGDLWRPSPFVIEGYDPLAAGLP